MGRKRKGKLERMGEIVRERERERIGKIVREKRERLRERGRGLNKQKEKSVKKKSAYPKEKCSVIGSATSLWNLMSVC